MLFVIVRMRLCAVQVVVQVVVHVVVRDTASKSARLLMRLPQSTAVEPSS